MTSQSNSMRHFFRCCVMFGCCYYVAPLAAEHAEIEDERTLLVNGIYRASARVVFDMDQKVQEALDNGVPLVVDLEIGLIRKRRWLWPEVIHEFKQRYMLYYHALSRRYIVKDVNKGSQQSYRYIDDALDSIGNVYDVPLIAADALRENENYRVRMRASFDVEALPTPIRLWAYFGADWKLTRGWNQWPLKP